MTCSHPSVTVMVNRMWLLGSRERNEKRTGQDKVCTHDRLLAARNARECRPLDAESARAAERPLVGAFDAAGTSDRFDRNGPVGSNCRHRRKRPRVLRGP